ncbi:hypothetical protein EK904_003620, partial [Melospiza melodia maxima]
MVAKGKVIQSHSKQNKTHKPQPLVISFVAVFYVGNEVCSEVMNFGKGFLVLISLQFTHLPDLPTLGVNERKDATGSHSLTALSFAKDRARSGCVIYHWIFAFFQLFSICWFFVGEIEYYGRSFLKCVARITGVSNDNTGMVSPTMADLQAVSSVFQGVAFLAATAFLQQSLVLITEFEKCFLLNIKDHVKDSFSPFPYVLASQAAVYIWRWPPNPQNEKRAGMILFPDALLLFPQVCMLNPPNECSLSHSAGGGIHICGKSRETRPQKYEITQLEEDDPFLFFNISFLKKCFFCDVFSVIEHVKHLMNNSSIRRYCFNSKTLERACSKETCKEQNKSIFIQEHVSFSLRKRDKELNCSKIAGEAVPQECGDALVQNISKFICLLFHGIHPSVECLPERELLSSCSCATVEKLRHSREINLMFICFVLFHLILEVLLFSVLNVNEQIQIFFFFFPPAMHVLDNDIECSDNINPAFVPSVSRIGNENYFKNVLFPHCETRSCSLRISWNTRNGKETSKIREYCHMSSKSIKDRFHTSKEGKFLFQLLKGTVGSKPISVGVSVGFNQPSRKCQASLRAAFGDPSARCLPACFKTCPFHLLHSCFVDRTCPGTREQNKVYFSVATRVNSSISLQQSSVGSLLPVFSSFLSSIRDCQMLSGSHRKEKLFLAPTGSANNKQPVYPTHKMQNLIFLGQHQQKTLPSSTCCLPSLILFYKYG